ncbi:C45 family autoproteolytic acyltransferase/hydolase [Pseudactinotalea terrae]|uniref:C45 family autoproteolytic acyltransferase/hydolase n=1 Tax=Pseudactinotalea terrae TaxID=1743262 RepID=UPI0012E2A7C1|nr:C45 family peptidase [Pseudactinotalea terrae]
MIHTWRTDETDPAARGEELGTRWRDEVRATLAEYEALFAGRGVTPAVVQDLSKDSREVVAEHAPEILAEIDGVATGAGIEPWQAMALNARTEILARASVITEECSTSVFLPADGGAPRTVQTWDWYSQMAHETLVRSQPAPGDARVVMFGEFGQVAKIGVSSRGLGVHFNILQHSSDGSRTGVPVHVLTRMILDRAGTLQEALEIVDGVPLGASTVLTVMTAEPAAACVELSPAGWAAIRATPGEPLLHTNHFLDPALAAGETPATAFSTTRERLDFLQGRAAAVEIREPLARVTALASEQPGSICVDPDPRRALGDRPQTKATFTIDVGRAELGFHPGHPRQVEAATWTVLGAAVTP